MTTHHNMMRAAAKNPQLAYITDVRGTFNTPTVVTSTITASVQNGDVLVLVHCNPNGSAANETSITGTWNTIIPPTDSQGAAWWRVWQTGDPVTYTITAETGTSTRNQAYVLAIYRAPFYATPSTVYAEGVSNFPAVAVTKGTTLIRLAIDNGESMTTTGLTSAGFTVRANILASGNDSELILADRYFIAATTVPTASAGTTCTTGHIRF